MMILESLLETIYKGPSNLSNPLDSLNKGYPLFKVRPLFKTHPSAKGQSYVIQFLMFFIIGMSLFILLGNFFRYQSENIRSQLLEYSTEMIGSHISSLVVSSIEGCPDCGVVEHSFRLARTYAGHFIEMDIDRSGLKVKTAPEAAEYDSSFNLLNNSVDIPQSSTSSVKTINLTYNKNQNKLEIT